MVIRLPRIFGDPIKFYASTCPKCGFHEIYQVSDYETIEIDADGTSTDSNCVKTLPKVCPKCGAKLNSKRMPSPLIH